MRESLLVHQMREPLLNLHLHGDQGKVVSGTTFILHNIQPIALFSDLRVTQCPLFKEAYDFLLVKFIFPVSVKSHCLRNFGD